MASSPILRQATAVVLDDPAAGKKALLVFNHEEAIYMEVGLSDLKAVRAISLPELQTYLEGPAMVVNPTFARFVLDELAKITTKN